MKTNKKLKKYPVGGRLVNRLKSTVNLSSSAGAIVFSGILALSGTVSSQAEGLAPLSIVSPEKAIPGQYIVLLKPQLTAQAQSLAEQDAMISATAFDIANAVDGEMVMHYAGTVQGMVLKMDKAKLKLLQQDERVELIEQDQIMSINDTQENATWGLDRIDQESLPLNTTYVFETTAANVNSYVLDTGISNHNDFGGRLASGYTSINDGQGTNDCNGHGTHVAGTVGSATWGVAKKTRLFPVRVLGCNGSGTNSGVISGVNWVGNNAQSPAVANMSLGGGNSTALDNAVKSAVDKGVTFVVAAGNDNSDACSGSPNRVREAITVASTTRSDQRSDFSNWGSCVDLFAPGSSITSTSNSGGTKVFSGTSMASPHVAGAAALVLAANPSASPAQVMNALKEGATRNKIGNPRGTPNLLVRTTVGVVDPDPDPDPGNEETIKNLSGSYRTWRYYEVTIPAGTSFFQANISGGSGDADIYVRQGSRPTVLSYDCRPYSNGNNENCQFDNPAATTWHIGIRAYRAYNGVTLNWSYR